MLLSKGDDKMNIIARIIDKMEKEKSAVHYWRKKGAIIGEDAEIYSTANFGSEPYLISIGNHVRINHGVQLVTHDGGVWTLRGLYPEHREVDLFGRIKIGNNVHIGTNAIVMPNVTIGDNCIIGCGAIVTRDIPGNSIAAGVPARVIEDIDTYLHKNKEKFDYTKPLSQEHKEAYLKNKFNL
jgi:acetyltransferase-like isoleucine patch superfamily enzyme